MWRPNSVQWVLIWILALVIVLFWPSQQNSSLAIKIVNWAADPADRLPRPPGRFSLEDGENPAAVEAHDEQEAEYERIYASSRVARIRIRLRDMSDPFDSSTQRQILVVIGVMGALVVWRLGDRQP